MSSESNRKRVDPTLKSLGFFQRVDPTLKSLGFFQRVDPTLKSLGFFQVVVRKVATRLSVLYDNATVKLTAGAVYCKIEGKAFEILLVADRKVGNAMAMLQSRIGVVEKTKEVAKTLYMKSELVVKLVWHKMDQVQKFIRLLIPSLPFSSYYYDDMDRLTTYMIEGFLFGFLFYATYHILRFLYSLIPLKKIKNLIFQKLKVQ